MACTYPARTSRRLASPDAETTSYFAGLVAYRLNASSLVPKTWTVVSHPELSSNGFTQLTVGSVPPFSASPGHASTDSAPSPVPTAVGRLNDRFGVPLVAQADRAR